MASKGLAKLKVEMLFNQDLTRLVDVMKGIAASQYQMMERRLTKLERYTKAVEDLFGVYDFRLHRHPFLRAASKKKLICLVTTDSGFLGGLNMKVVQAGMKQEDKDTHYLVIGERGANYMREFKRDYTAFPGINTDESRFGLVTKVVSHMTQVVTKGEFGSVLLVYPRALSFTAQRVETLNLIPCPLFFKNRSAGPIRSELQDKQVILESKANGILEYLTQLWLRKRFVEVFESAKLSEFGARTMHLEESYQTLSKVNKQLKLDFFKARREKIDQSLRESFIATLLLDD